MNYYEHLRLPEFNGNLNKKKRNNGFPRYDMPAPRDKKDYYSGMKSNIDEISRSFQQIKQKFSGKINPNLIYRLKVNQSVGVEAFEKILFSLGELKVLSFAEDKKGYWVVFSTDEHFKNFQGKLSQYSGIVPDGHKYEFFNAIDGVEDIPEEEKLGNSLKRNPMSDSDPEYLNMELWRMEDDQLREFISGLVTNYSQSDFQIYDKLITKSFALYRIRINKKTLDEIIKFKEVAKIDRPFIPTFKLSEYKGIDITDVEVVPPDDDAVGILVVDSGIIAGHPLLESTVGAEENFQEGESETQDIAGHGTAVSGFAVYGELEKRMVEKKFHSSNWLFSAKVMYGQYGFDGQVMGSTYDPQKLLESQFKEAIQHFLDNPSYKVKVVNISFGNSDEILNEESNRQFPLAALIDELAFEYSECVFVVSAGNRDFLLQDYDSDDVIENYPDYLTNDESFRLINPATASLAITVGSIANDVKYLDNGFSVVEKEIWHPVADSGQPSPFTRVGPGINSMIKPEVVHIGGNYIIKKDYGGIVRTNLGGNIPVLSNKPLENPFTFDHGTSYSAPIVANILGQIANKFPQKNADYLKNLLLQSADNIDMPVFTGNNTTNKNSSLRVQGYGLPNVDKAIHSFDNRVILLDEGSIGLNKVKIYSVNIPREFFEIKGYKRISVVLTFTPETRATRGDSYLGNRMEFKVFHSINPQILEKEFAEVNHAIEIETPEKLKKFEWDDMFPKVNARKMGCHQKGIKEFKQKPPNIPESPISIMITNSNKWITDENYQQNYCLSVMFEHKEEIEIYNKIRMEVQQRVRIR
ncbi:S8 family peptidase [Lysinibacillus endophyticus]|uniref:S8 family peptidase n=1 Tax=Ureibacillus endophyticus TaxID=1978490 RepID=UPI003135FE55